MIKFFEKNAPPVNTIIRHTVFISAYYLYEIGMLYAFTGHGVYFLDATIHLVINLCFFYFNAHLVLAYSSSRTGRFSAILSSILLIVLEFLVFLAAKYLTNTLLPLAGIPTSRPFKSWETLLRDVLWRFIYLIGLSSAYWFALSSAAKQRRLAKLEHTRLRELAEGEIIKQELLAAENAFLRSQINSHFLFNTLNYVHASVHHLNQQAGEAIIHLSDILRYSFSTTEEGMVKLSCELKFIGDIFQITRIKSTKALQLQFTVEETPGELQIIPLVLITLAENMLKYADLYDAADPAKFSCRIDPGTLSIHITNKKHPGVSPFSSGIGMKNMEKRLRLAYQDQYTLEVTDSQSRYQLTLIIPLNHAIQNPNC